MIYINSLLAIMISVGIAEIVMSLLGAIGLGFAIHFFLSSRKDATLQFNHSAEQVAVREADEWKLKYFNDTEELDKKIQKLHHELKQARENDEFLTLELDSIRQEREELLETQAELATTKPSSTESTDYLGQLQYAQQNLLQQNEQMGQLLQHIQQQKQSEQQQLELLRSNEQLNKNIAELKIMLVDRDNEIRILRQQTRLSDEMQARLEKVYADYNGMLEKMQKLEAYINESQKEGVNYSELQDNYFKVSKEVDALKLKYSNLLDENQRQTRNLADVEDKLREANFQRQQLQKKVTYLEGLNNDLQQVAEHHNKLHSQMRRLSEIEQLLAKATKSQQREDEK